MTQVIVNLGTGGADLNGRSGSTTGADSNDPKFLAWEGENYVYLPGVSGNYLSVPDEAALDITGDIDIRVRVALDDWTPDSTSMLATKRNAASTDYSWILFINTDGTLELNWSSDGSSAVSTASESTVATGITNESATWVRATLDVDNGASGYDLKYWLSDDGVTWNQLGSTITGGATTSIYSGAADVRVGVQFAATPRPAAGKFYRAEVWDGIEGSGGTKVLDVDTSLVASGSDTSFTALTGQTVTINRSTSGRKSVAVVSPVWLFGTDDYMEVADNALLDFGASDSFTVLAVVRNWSWSSQPNIAKTASFTTAPDVGYLIYLTTTPGSQFYIKDGAVASNDFSQLGTIGSLTTLMGVRNTSTNTLSSYVDGTVSTPATDNTTGSLANSLPLYVGRVGSSYADMEFIAAAVFRRALTAGEIAAITTYFQNRVA